MVILCILEVNEQFGTCSKGILEVFFDRYTFEGIYEKKYGKDTENLRKEFGMF